MLQKIIIVLTVLAALWVNMAQINAQELSTNPWLEANDEEAVEAVYQKEQKRARRSSLQYQPEQSVTIDRTHAYIQAEESDEDEGFFDSVKNLISDDDDKEQALIPNTQANRRALAQKKQQQQQEDSSSMFDLEGLQNSLNVPQLPNATGLIQKLERATGVNFKNMGKYLQ